MVKKNKKEELETKKPDKNGIDISQKDEQKDKNNTKKQKKDLATLEDRCNILEQEKEEANGKYLRLLAEFENYRRRNEKERVNWIRNANEKFALKVCDVLDDFERAFEAKYNEEKESSFYQGVVSIYKKLENIIRSEGFEKIVALNEEFNPMYHEAISYIQSPAPADTVVSVVQNGYFIGNKVIRAAKVVVSSGQEETSDTQDQQSDKDNGN